MEAGCGLQGMLSSTGQVQCGQVHCRLPYAAPPVHLKADMDGPLSNRGEKVNGARLGPVGRSHLLGCWQCSPSPSRHHTALWQASSARHSQAPAVSLGQWLEQVPACSMCTGTPKASQGRPAIALSGLWI